MKPTKIQPKYQISEPGQRKHQLYATIHDLTPQYTDISRSPINVTEDGNYDEWRVVEVVVDCATNRKSFESYSKQI